MAAPFQLCIATSRNDSRELFRDLLLGLASRFIHSTTVSPAGNTATQKMLVCRKNKAATPHIIIAGLLRELVGEKDKVGTEAIAKV